MSLFQVSKELHRKGVDISRAEFVVSVGEPSKCISRSGLTSFAEN
jgi:hypothetical protein